MYKTILLSALVTPFTLVGGMLLGGVLGSLVNNSLPGHLNDTTRTLIALGAALIGVVVGGALWGMTVQRLTGAGEMRRMAWAGALGFGLAALLSALALTAAEVVIVTQRRGPDLPLHQLFTLLFVPSATLTAAGGALALGLAQRDVKWAGRLAVLSGLAGGLAFLVVNLGMDAAGWRVGAPGAEQRATMITVMLLGSSAAAIAGGAVVGGLSLKRRLAS